MHDVNVDGANESIQELLAKARALTVLAHYAREPLAGSQLDADNHALAAGHDDGTALMSAFLQARLDHAAAHVHSICIIAAHPGGVPYTALAPHQRAVMEDGLSFLWVTDPTATDAARYVRLGQYLIEDVKSLQDDPQLPPEVDLDKVKNHLIGRYIARGKASAFGEVRKVDDRPYGRGSVAKKLFDSTVQHAWYRLSADSHYSAAWDQVLLYGGSRVRQSGADLVTGVRPLDPREDSIRNYAATIRVLDEMLEGAVRILEVGSTDKKVQQRT